VKSKTLALLGLVLTTSFVVSDTILLPLNGVSEPRIVGNRARYPRQLREYAAAYRVHVWTIKQWIKTGKAGPELPPLDHPGQMAAWYERTHSHCAPDNLLAANAVGDAQLTKKESARPESTANVSDAEPLTLEENVERLRRHLAITERGLSEALARGDDTAAALRQRTYLLTMELLRKAEDTLFSLQRQRGEFVAKSEVLETDAVIANQVRQIVERMEGKIDNRISNMPNEVRDHVRAAVQTEIQSVYACLRVMRESHVQSPPNL
jgi:hypothetical protein